MYSIIPISTQNDNEFILMFAVRVGAINDPPHLAGISHLLEHILFFSKHVHSSYFTELGKLAVFNAQTSLDTTTFFIKCNFDNYQQICSKFFFVIKSLTVTTKQLEIERQVVIEEIVTNKSPLDTFSIMHAGTPYANDAGGTEKTVKNITMKDLNNHYEKYYNDVNVFFVAPERHHKLVQNYLANLLHSSRFSKTRQNQNGVMEMYVHKSVKNAQQIVIRKGTKTGNCEYILTIKTCPYYLKQLRKWYDLYAITVKEKLYEIVREKYGQMYNAVVNHNYYHMSGNLVVFIRTKPGKHKILELLLPIMLSCIDESKSAAHIQQYEAHQKIRENNHFTLLQKQMMETMFTCTENMQDFTKFNPKIGLFVSGASIPKKIESSLFVLMSRLSDLSADKIDSL